MRLLLCLFSAALCSALLPARAQSGSPWATVTTLAASSHYTSFVDIQLPTPTSAWCIFYNEYGMGASTLYINASDDDGVSWQSKDISIIYPYYGNNNQGSGSSFADFWAIDGHEAWAVVKQQATGAVTLQHTTTGPAGFAATTAQVPRPVAVRFFTPTTGIVFSSGPAASIYRTTNSGQSWQPVTMVPALTYNYATSGKCQVVGQHVWLSDATGKLVHSADAGLTWTTTTLAVPLQLMTFRDGLHGLARGTSSPWSLYRTADGGLTWTVVSPTGPLYTETLLALPSRPGTYLSASAGWYTHGTSVSYDEGQTWAALDNTVTSSLAADATGRVWASLVSTNPDNVRLGRLATTALATATAQPLGIELYPNPTTGVVHLPALPDYQQVTVYDLAGRQCRISPLNRAGTTLDLSGLGAGSYLLRLEGRAAVPRQQRVTVAP